jgi:hypothetical protein
MGYVQHGGRRTQGRERHDYRMAFAAGVRATLEGVRQGMSVAELDKWYRSLVGLGHGWRRTDSGGAPRPPQGQGVRS